jgi:hypothetical protein
MTTYVYVGPLVLPQTGTYIVVLTPVIASLPTDGTGSAFAAVFSIPPDATAALTPSGTATNFTVTTPGQHGSFTFSGSAGQKVSLLLDLSQLTGCASYSIVNPDSTVLITSSSCFGVFYVNSGPIVLPQSGTYTLAIVPALRWRPNDGTGLVFATLFNVPADATVPLAFGTQANLTLTTPGQHGNFTFSGTAGQKVSLLFDFTQMTNNVTISIINPDNSILIAPSNIFQSGFANNNAPIALPQTGTYTVTLAPVLLGLPTSGIGTLSATVFSIPADATASLAFGGTEASFVLTTPGQHGNFTFAGTAGQKVSLLLDFTRIPNSTTYSVLNPNNSVLVASTRLTGAGYATGAPIILPQTGTYTVTNAPTISTRSTDGTGPAFAAIFNVPADATALLTAGAPASTVNITTPGQHGAFTFSGTAGQKVTLLLDINSLSTCATYSILKPDGSTLVASSRSCFNIFVTNASIVLPQSGTYTLPLVPDLPGEPYGGTGTLGAVLFTVPADATAPAAIGGPTATLNLTTPGQHGSFTFSGTAGQKVNVLIDSNQMTTCDTYSILNPSGSTLVAATHICSRTTVSSLTLPQTGTYTLPIVPDFGTTATSGTGFTAVTISPSP